MARIIQVLLPLLYVVLAVAHLNLPFFNHIPGPPHLAQPISDGPRDSGYDPWFPWFNFGNPEVRSFDSDSHNRDKSHEIYDPFYHGDPYYQGNGWDQMPGINNVFDIPNPGYNDHTYQPLHKENNPQEKPKQDHKDNSNIQKPGQKLKEIPTIDKTPTEHNKDPKLNEDNISDLKNKSSEAITSDVTTISELLPPKTNEIKKGDEKKDKDNKQVGLDKNKDFLLVGEGNDGNNVYLLHENNPTPNTVVSPSGIQPGNNIVYVPYNPGQTSYPIYQVINGQPGSLPKNIQISPDKVGVSSDYNNAVTNPGQATMNVNAGNQNPGYVTIYSNGQLIQIPGVIINSAPKNVPIQKGNQGQGTNYIIANTVPNNVQTVPGIPNSGTNVIYAAIPNQASNSPIYVQVPNCFIAMGNGCSSSTVQGVNNGISSNGLPSNVVFYQANPNMVAQPAVLANGVPNGYVQPNMLANQSQGPIIVAIPNQGAVYSNQNSPYQQAVELPVNSASNGYNPPIGSNLGHGQNEPNQGDLMNNQNMAIQTAVLLPVGNSNNRYNQPMATNPGQGPNIPYQGAIQMPSTTSNNGYYQPSVSNQRPEFNAPKFNNQGVMYSQYTPTQPAVQMPVNNGINGYAPNEPNQGVTVNNKNTPLQPGVEIPIPSGYNVNPPVINPSPTVTIENRKDRSSNQNVQPQPSVTVNSGSNGFQQPQLTNQRDQGSKAIVNSPNNGDVINLVPNTAQPLAKSSPVLDINNLSSLGAQPAITMSNLKDKSGDKNDKTDKEPKDEIPKVPELFTIRMIDVKR